MYSIYASTLCTIYKVYLPLYYSIFNLYVGYIWLYRMLMNYDAFVYINIWMCDASVYVYVWMYSDNWVSLTKTSTLSFFLWQEEHSCMPCWHSHTVHIVWCCRAVKVCVLTGTVLASFHNHADPQEVSELFSQSVFSLVVDNCLWF